MKNILVFAFLFLFASSQTFCQKTDYSVDWGPSYKKEGGLFSTNKLIGLYGDNYYTLSSTRKSTTLLKFDMNHKLVSNKPISKKYEGDKIRFSNFIDTKNGTFAYMPQVAKGEWKILVSKFDGNDFGKIRNVFSHDFQVKRIALYGMGINSDAINRLVVSTDEKRVAYTNVLSMKEKKSDEETMVVALFNADMELEWDKRQNFGYKDKSIRIKQTVVDPNGVVYVLAVVSDKAKKIGGKSKNRVSKGVKNDEDKVSDKARNLPQFHYSIFRITKDDMKEFKIDLKNGDIAPIDIAMYFPDQTTSDMIVSGFYTDSERRSGIKGMFYASGSGKSGISKVKINKFDDEFLKDFATERDLKKDRGLSANYDIDDFIQFSDGSIGFVAEQYYVTSTTTTDSQGRTRTTYYYHSNNILIPRFSKDGTLLNAQKVKKNFTSTYAGETSYSIAVANNNIYLVFNDYKSKAERKDIADKDKKVKKAKRRWRYTDLVVLSTDGEMLYNETLFNSNEIDLIFIPSMCEYSSDVMILGSISRKEYAFGTIKLK